MENLQREDLNPIDKAHAVKAFMEEGAIPSPKLPPSWVYRAQRLLIGCRSWMCLRSIAAVMSNFYGGHSPLTASHHVGEAVRSKGEQPGDARGHP